MTEEHESPMNMTGEHDEPMHHMNSTKPWKKYDQKSEDKEKPSDRKRRNVGRTVQGVVDTASNAVHSVEHAVGGVVGDVEQTGEALVNGAEEGASNLIDEVEKEI